MTSNANIDMFSTDAAGASPAGRRRLENLPSSPRLTGEQAAARSVIIKRLRIALPIVAFVLIGAFFMTSGRQTQENVFLDEFKDVNASAEDLRMANPEFSGIDAKGNPFNITATAAIQSPGAEKSVALESPRAITSRSDAESVVTAKEGDFKSDQNLLFLRKDVTFEHTIGGARYVLVTPAATVFIDNELVQSDTGVEGTGPDGARLTADRMRANNDSGRVIFEGNVSMRLYPSNEKTTSAADAVPEEKGSDE